MINFLNKTILVGYLLFFSNAVRSMVTVEGILLGEANTHYQSDPLITIFQPNDGQNDENEARRIKYYQYLYFAGVSLNESCSLYGPLNYGSVWHEKQAKRSVVSTLQYLGLDLTIKAIGAYAREMQLPLDAYRQLTTNLVGNYCSENITVFSRKTIEKAFQYYFDTPHSTIIPQIHSSPYFPAHYKTITNSKSARSKEFDQAVLNFRSLCSWGGDVADYRMLPSHLKNPFIMAEVFRNLSGMKPEFDYKEKKIELVNDQNSLQVSCTELICRKTDLVKFQRSFPLSVGSTGIETDLKKLYCQHFRMQEYPRDTLTEVRGWIKEQELEDPILETNYFISLLTGVPDGVFGINNYAELVGIAKSSIDERWLKWAHVTLKSFSKDLLFEESLKVRPVSRRDMFAVKNNGFRVDFSVTLGEMDRIMEDNDKLSELFELKISKNYFRWMKLRLADVLSRVDNEGREVLITDISKMINAQLKDKEKYFRQKIWNDELSVIIAEELLAQVNVYQGDMFDSLEEKMLKVPVKFSFGTFALNYLKYRSDVRSGRLQLKL